MKRLLLTIYCLLSLGCGLFAEEVEHIKFMGFPLTGSIDEVQARLMRKDFKVGAMSKTMAVGSRLFKGFFTGKEASVIVYYNKSLDNQVYSTRVFFDKHFSYEASKMAVEDMVDRLEARYGTRPERVFADDVDQYEKHTLSVYGGWIYVWTQKQREWDENSYLLLLEYHDAENELQNYRLENEDL